MLANAIINPTRIVIFAVNTIKGAIVSFVVFMAKPLIIFIARGNESNTSK